MKTAIWEKIFNQYKTSKQFKDWINSLSCNSFIKIEWHALHDSHIYISGKLSWNTGIKLLINFDPNNLFIKDVDKVLLPQNRFHKFKKNDYIGLISTANWMLD